MSSNLKGSELNYHEVDKQTFAVFKVVKHFCPYLLKSKTKVIVPFSAVRNLLVQKDLGEKRAHWMAALQEYDLEIKPSQVIRGLGLCKLAAKLAHLPTDQNHIPFDDVLLQKEICFIPDPASSWYTKIHTYLETDSAPDNLDPKKKREVRLKSAPYQLVNNVLFRKNADGDLLCCLEKEKSDLVLTQLHDGPAGGHFGGDTTPHKILRPDYFWPNLF